MALEAKPTEVAVRQPQAEPAEEEDDEGLETTPPGWALSALVVAAEGVRIGVL